MKTVISAVLMGTGLLVAACASGQTPPGLATTHLEIGQVAPDFTLLDQNWKPVTLTDYRGKKNVVLAFYVLAFTAG